VEDANQVLDAAKENNAGIRIWVSDRLRGTGGTGSSSDKQKWRGRVEQAMAFSRSRWPGHSKVLEPSSLLSWDEGDPCVSKAMEKAVGEWLITENDEVSALLLSELGLPSISATGSRHMRGEMINDDVQGRGGILRQKMVWDEVVIAHGRKREELAACANGSDATPGGRQHGAPDPKATGETPDGSRSGCGQAIGVRASTSGSQGHAGVARRGVG
ncbi:unnamed protein product, partial [Discosporangium mesarthrocarpum]